MGEEETAGVAQQLEGTRASITEWRKSRRKKGPMPEELWAQAVALAGQLGVSRVSHALDLSYASDTHAKILELTAARMEVMNEDEPEMKGRTGVHTTGLVAVQADGENPIALFFTGRQHSGENIEDVLKLRESTLPLPIQMCDALAANSANDVKTLLSTCLTHGRRNYVDVVDDFPEDCRLVLKLLAGVYRNDAHAKERALSPDERLIFHQQNSEPLMNELHAWASKQVDSKTVEPNSGLGKAITYMLRHWDKLTNRRLRDDAEVSRAIARESVAQTLS